MKKKLTILIDWYLPGTKAGGPVRSIYSLVNLLKNDFEISIITTNTDLGSSNPYDGVQSNQWIDENGIRIYYFDKSTLNRTNLHVLLDEIGSDIIYLNSFWSYWFSIQVIDMKNKGLVKAKVILAPRGMLGKNSLAIKPLKKQIYLLQSKWRNFYRNTIFHATNKQEIADIKKHFPDSSVFIIPNVNTTVPEYKSRTKNKNEINLFYLSRIARIKGLYEALHLLADLPPAFKVNYFIYGNIEDKPYWDSCRDLISKLPANIHVEYKGEIPFYEIKETISKHHVLFMPTRNENFGHSIVESLSCGCPAIISDQTPWNDLQDFKAGYALILNDKEAWLSALRTLIQMDEKDYSEISLNAVEYITQKNNILLTKDKYTVLFNGQ